jgi:hypothetical protein
LALCAFALKPSVVGYFGSYDGFGRRSVFSQGESGSIGAHTEFAFAVLMLAKHGDIHASPKRNPLRSDHPAAVSAFSFFHKFSK